MKPDNRIELESPRSYRLIAKHFNITIKEAKLKYKIKSYKTSAR